MSSIATQIDCKVEAWRKQERQPEKPGVSARVLRGDKRAWLNAPVLTQGNLTGTCPDC